MPSSVYTSSNAPEVIEPTVSVRVTGKNQGIALWLLLDDWLEDDELELLELDGLGMLLDEEELDELGL